MMVSTVDDGQFALGQVKHVGKLTVQLSHTTISRYTNALSVL